jgi:hypothetical protein
MKGSIQVIYPEGRSSVYNYTCLGKDGLFSFPVEFRYHVDILESEGTPIGRKIEYKDDVDPPYLKFIDDKGVI